VDGAKSLVLAQIRSIWRRRWYAALVAWLFCLIGWGYVATMPDVFEARARIYVDTDSMLRPLMRGIAVDSNLLSQVDLMQRTLLSRPNLQKVVHLADLDLKSKSPAETDEIVDDLGHRVTVSSEGRNLFTINYRGPDRVVGTKVVQSLLNVFVESNLGSSRQDLQSARTFIDEQVRDYAKQLDEAEKRMADFKAKNIGFLPGDSNYAAKLEAAQQDLSKTQETLDDTRRQRDELQKQLAQVPKTIETTSAGPGSFGAGPPLGGTTDDTMSLGPDPAARVATLQQKLNELLEIYTDQYPDVVRIKKQLALAQREADEAKAKAAAQGNADAPPVDPRAVRSTAPNPVYDQLSLQLVSLNTTIASLQAKLKRNQEDVARWQGLAKSVPEVAAQMAKLSRDYDVTKRSYEELLSRREAAKIGSDIETQTQTVQFRIIDPPNAPPAPIAPNRILFFSAVLLGGIAAGGAFAFVLAQMDDSIKTVQELRELVPHPVLGMISIANMPRQRRWHAAGNAGFAAACIGLVLAYAGMLSVALMNTPHA